MIDIAAIHRASNSKKILGQFFTTSGFNKAYNYLLLQGLKPDEIVQRYQAYRGSVGVSNVHPFIAIEYLRWSDYRKYADSVYQASNQSSLSETIAPAEE